MGETCSCLTSSTEEKVVSDLYQSKNLFKPQAQEIIITPTIDIEDHSPIITQQMLIHAVAKGYLARKPFLPPANLKELPEYLIQDEEITKKYGSFILPASLEDGVEVNSQRPQVLEDGVLYHGEWNSKGQKHGRGKEFFSDGSLYLGTFSNGLRHGIGRVLQGNGNFYEGEFRDGKANGEGTYIDVSGSMYKGTFLDDLEHGFGREDYENKSYYKGEYECGIKQGYGKFYWPDGKVYKGHFDKNNIHGKGVYRWNDGKFYKGYFVNGKMEGKGHFEWADGKSYTGDYKEDKKHGYGKFRWADGREYRGEWFCGKEHGIGVLSWYVSEGEFVSKKGEWKNGKRVRWVNDEN